MWSKRGRSRNRARGKIFSPQPVSGVASPSSRARTRLAMRLVTRFTPLSRRVTRWPATSSGSPATDSARARAQSRGMSAGSFCPSPSMVAIQSPRAARTPLTNAADWPQDRPCRSATSGKRAIASASRAGVSSEEPSSTQTTS